MHLQFAKTTKQDISYILEWQTRASAGVILYPSLAINLVLWEIHFQNPFFMVMTESFRVPLKAYATAADVSPLLEISCPGAFESPARDFSMAGNHFAAHVSSKNICHTRLRSLLGFTTHWTGRQIIIFFFSQVYSGFMMAQLRQACIFFLRDLTCF